MDICGNLQDRQKIVSVIFDKPYRIAQYVGFTKLTELHNKWIKLMINGTSDMTLQAHRG